MTTERDLRDEEELADGVIVAEIITDPRITQETREALERFRKDGRLLTEMAGELLAKWPEEYFGIFEGKLFHAPRLTTLLDELRAGGIDPGHAVVRFLSRQRRWHA